MDGDRAARAAIIAVGSELLTPERLDTNSLFLTQQLNELGVDLRFKQVVGDQPDDLADAIGYAMSRVGVIVITGGLGPTDDDITRETVARVFDRRLIEDDGIVATIRSRFEARGLPMPEINRRQALAPERATVLPNANGTAPGLWLTHDDVVCIVLPGPPRELQRMFTEQVRARLASRVAPASQLAIFRRVLRIAGRTESHVEEITHPVYSRWRTASVPVATSILASLGQIELHLAVRSPTPAEASRVLGEATAQLADVLGRDLVSTDGARLEDVVGRLLADRGQRVAVAESCTGGLISSRLTDVPGSSAYVQAGWVVYSNDAKVALLGVDAAAIETHGAVSEPVATMMALGARTRAGVDYGIGVTGIAGPGGGSPEKPVGTVFVALAGPEDLMRVRRLSLPGERQRVKFQASQAALDLLRRTLIRSGA